MKKQVFFIVFMLVLFRGAASGQGWECENCPKRDLALFDLDVWQREPLQAGSGLDPGTWLEMFMVAGGIADALFNEDPSSECINFYDGQMAMINEWSDNPWENKNYASGFASLALPPPAGMSNNLEYLVSGSIGKSTGGGYIIIVYVQAGGTGERVAEATMPYNLSISGMQNGKNIAREIMPVMQFIRDFERKKRDEVSEVFIAPDGKGAEKEITPDKEKIKGGESTDVEIRLIDCDGVPIRDMSVKLSAKGGSFNPEKVETEDDGTGKSTFTADCDPGKYSMTMEFEGRYPFSYEKNTFGNDKDFEVEAGDKFDLIYKHTMTHDYGGQFLLKSTGKGTIRCTINWEADPPTVKGDGTVKATWSGNADVCKFEGNSNSKVFYEGNVVYSENGQASLKLKKTGDSDLGGEFKIICKSVTQSVPASFPFPALEEDRVLDFSFTGGATKNFDIGGVGNYSYTIKLNCK